MWLQTLDSAGRSYFVWDTEIVGANPVSIPNGMNSSVLKILKYALMAFSIIRVLIAIKSYHFELGSKDYMFSYSYIDGKVYEKSWGNIKY